MLAGAFDSRVLGVSLVTGVEFDEPELLVLLLPPPLLPPPPPPQAISVDEISSVVMSFKKLFMAEKLPVLSLLSQF